MMRHSPLIIRSMACRDAPRRHPIPSFVIPRLAAAKLVIGDGHLGIWGALAAAFPEAKEQRCWNHRLLNVLDKLPPTRPAEARSLLTKIPYAETREEAERQKRAFQAWCTKRGHAEVGRVLDRDWERMV